MKKILPLFSYIFHPVFIPLMAAVVYLSFAGSHFVSNEKLFVLLIIGILTFFLPLLSFLLLRKAGAIESVMAPKSSERKIPLVLHCFLLILLVRKSITLDRYPELHFFFLGTLLSSSCALLLVFGKIKASLHMAGISALTLFTISLSLHFQTQDMYRIAFLVLMNGFVASSRLEMQAHTHKELLFGLLIGCLPQMALLPFWL